MNKIKKMKESGKMIGKMMKKKKYNSNNKKKNLKKIKTKTNKMIIVRMKRKQIMMLYINY